MWLEGSEAKRPLPNWPSRKQETTDNCAVTFQFAHSAKRWATQWEVPSDSWPTTHWWVDLLHVPARDSQKQGITSDDCEWGELASWLEWGTGYFRNCYDEERLSRFFGWIHVQCTSRRSGKLFEWYAASSESSIWERPCLDQLNLRWEEKDD